MNVNLPRPRLVLLILIIWFMLAATLPQSREGIFLPDPGAPIVVNWNSGNTRGA